MKQRKRNGDASARPPDIDELINQIFLSEYRSLELFAYSKLRDHHMAEVVVQEAFTLALEKHEKFINSSDPVKWLYESVRYISLHAFRDRQYLLMHIVPLDEYSEAKLGCDDSYSLIPKEIMDSPEMKLLWEFYIAGYTAKELSSKYGIEVAACKMRILRARKKLVEKLKTYR